MVCLVLDGSSLEADFALIETDRSFIDCAEIRADYLDSIAPAALAEFSRRVQLPLILTIRRVADGGGFAGAESRRLELLTETVKAGVFAFVDVEDDIDTEADSRIADLTRRRGGRTIRSFHDFDGVPADLSARVGRNRRHPSDVPRAAVMPKTNEDSILLLGAIREAAGAGGDFIILGMGEVGLWSRLLAPRLGNLFSFASPTGRQAAPGHVDARRMAVGCRHRAQGPATTVFGVVGNPIAHSKSPEIHNSGYDSLGLDSVYVPFLTDAIDGFLTFAAELGVAGLSVTVPFKEAVVARLAEADPAVRAVGACNTILSGASGWRGYNTDVEGFLAPLREAVGSGWPAGKKALVLGAGGAARAAVYGLLREDASVCIANRGMERARALADAMARVGFPAPRILGLDELGAIPPPDLVVQTTKVGMHPEVDAEPAPQLTFSGREVAYDLVYNPPETRFLRRARGAGCRTIGGAGMLLRQAYDQFSLYTGRDYPRQRLEPSLLDSISR